MEFKKWLTEAKDNPKLTVKAVFRLTEPTDTRILLVLRDLATPHSDHSHFEQSSFSGYTLWATFVLEKRETSKDVRNYLVHKKTGKAISAGLARGAKIALAMAEGLEGYWNEGKVQNATIDIIHSTGPGNVYELPRQPRSGDHEIARITRWELPDKGRDPGSGGGGDGGDGRDPDYPTPIRPPGGFQKTRQQTQLALTAGVIRT